MQAPSDPSPSLDRVTQGRILRLWFPLALSWLCMAIELPFITAVMGRMANAEVQLAAVGTIAFPLALLIEGPVVMLLSASTALCKDRATFRRVRRYAWVMGVGLSGLHALVCLPWIYEPLVGQVIGAPANILRAGHPALWALVPWTAAIAYRRFHQGILIRAERGKHVTQGTLFRLLGDALVLACGYAFDWPGALTAGLALSAGVLFEAAFIGWVVRPSVAELEAKEPHPDAPDPVPHWRAFGRFYVPLAITPILGFLTMPIGASAMTRMNFELESMAVWQALHGLVFVPRSLALAYNEVVIRLSEVPGSMVPLLRFTRGLALGNTGLLALFALTPLGTWVFTDLFGLSPVLAVLGAGGLLISLPQPGLMASQSFHMAWLVGHGRTAVITQSMGLYLVLTGLFLVGAYRWGQQPGILYMSGAFSVAGAIQVCFLAWRSLPLRKLHAVQVPPTASRPPVVPGANAAPVRRS